MQFTFIFLSIFVFYRQDEASYRSCLPFFFIQDGFVCQGEESGLQFDEVDLTELEWVDYDEKATCSVGITELEWKFEKA